MSRIGHYVLHIYCDNPNNHGGVTPMFQEFTGVSESHASLMAMRAGWRRVKGKDLCPKCSGKGKLVSGE